MKKLLLTLTLSLSIFSYCAGQYNVLFNFDGTNGLYPSGTLVISGNKLYGTTQFGGKNNKGCIYSIDINGNDYKDLHDFDSINGSYPPGGLTLLNSKLYGLTTLGGLYDDGIIFSIDTNGNGFKDLFDFNGTNGYMSYSSLTLLGNKFFGGTQNSIFSIDTNGNGFKKLASIFPEGVILLAGNKLFGMSQYGGADNSGFIFSIDTNGTAYKDIFDFNGPNGKMPNYDALLLSGNTLYSMVTKGGAHDSGCIFSIDTNGTGYIDLHDFNSADGGYPEGGLTISENTLIGTTFEGGVNNYGTLFSINTNGTGFTDLFDFTFSSGTAPWNMALTLSGNTLFGAASNNGSGNSGTIFSYEYIGLGINNLSSTNNSINVYPNPSNGQFTISLSHPELVSGSQTKVEVYNILGACVFNETLKQVQGDNTINLSSQPSGVYLYRVIAEDGNLLGEGKLVIER